MMNPMRLKDAVILYYDKKNKNCVLKHGVDVFTIEDSKQHYYQKLTTYRDSIDSISDSEILTFLIENNLVVREYEKNTVSNTLKKNLSYFENSLTTLNASPLEVQQDLTNKKILIIGCGGTGTVVLKNLSLIGIKNFVLIDGDKVGIDNLNRQLFFSEKDVGEKKVEVLKKKLTIFEEESKVRIYDLFIEEQDTLSEILKIEQVDFVINCADTPKDILNIVGKSCLTSNVPFISGAVGIVSGHWGPIYDEYNIFKDINKNNSEYLIPKLEGSVPYTNMLIATFIVKDVISYFLKEVMSRFEHLYNKKTLNFEKNRIDIL